MAQIRKLDKICLPKYIFNPYQIKFIIFRINNTYTYTTYPNIIFNMTITCRSQKIHDKEALLHTLYGYREAHNSVIKDVSLPINYPSNVSNVGLRDNTMFWYYHPYLNIQICKSLAHLSLHLRVRYIIYDVDRRNVSKIFFNYVVSLVRFVSELRCYEIDVHLIYLLVTRELSIHVLINTSIHSVLAGRYLL